MGCLQSGITVELPFKGNWGEHQPDDTLESLEKAIHSHFIPALTGQPPPREHTQEMLVLPARLGGLGLTNPTTSAKGAASQQISAPLVDRIINQDQQLGNCHSSRASKGEFSTLSAQSRKNMPKNSTNLSPTFHGTLRKRVPPPG